MADKNEKDRFIQNEKGVEITNIPPETLALIKKQQAEADQEAGQEDGE